MQKCFTVLPLTNPALYTFYISNNVILVFWISPTIPFTFEAYLWLDLKHYSCCICKNMHLFMELQNAQGVWIRFLIFNLVKKTAPFHYSLMLILPKTSSTSRSLYLLNKGNSKDSDKRLSIHVIMELGSIFVDTL